jgi:hypothetical protein
VVYLDGCCDTGGKRRKKCPPPNATTSETCNRSEARTRKSSGGEGEVPQAPGPSPSRTPCLAACFARIDFLRGTTTAREQFLGRFGVLCRVLARTRTRAICSVISHWSWMPCVSWVGVGEFGVSWVQTLWRLGGWKGPSGRRRGALRCLAVTTGTTTEAESFFNVINITKCESVQVGNQPALDTCAPVHETSATEIQRSYGCTGTQVHQTHEIHSCNASQGADECNPAYGIDEAATDRHRERLVPCLDALACKIMAPLTSTVS